MSSACAGSAGLTSTLRGVAAATLAWAAIVAPACNPEVPTATPDGAWRAFRKAVERSNNAGAYRLLSADDQAALTSRAADAGPGVQPAQMLNVDRRSLPPWRDMRVSVDEGGERAAVTIVLDDGVEEDRQAVREPDGWRVVLGVSPP